MVLWLRQESSSSLFCELRVFAVIHVTELEHSKMISVVYSGGGHAQNTPGLRYSTAGNLFLLWVLAIAFWGIGLFFLYRSGTRKRYRTITLHPMRNVSPMWVSKSLSIIVGLAAIAFGTGIIFRVLKY